MVNLVLLQYIADVRVENKMLAQNVLSLWQIYLFYTWLFLTGSYLVLNISTKDN